ncbi:MAG: adenylyltransferase/cytidyltransferase family protein [Lachnospiraceae bacterium]|nr:adenylyltransferase/cytidyltransferase family protein [Lachnospiraceae bacterium]
MTKVITYGTFDLLHYGHVRLLERAKALGDHLIVGVTSDDYDLSRGKINVRQSLTERMEAVRATGLADEIIVEEYAGQKIDDIRRLGVDIFTVGSDWTGQFDYLKEYCRVVYLDRTEGVSSSQLRGDRPLRLGFAGEVPFINKVYRESLLVNGLQAAAFWAEDDAALAPEVRALTRCASYEDLLEQVDAVYVTTAPGRHVPQIREALSRGRHVLCEAPIAIDPDEVAELYALARAKGCALETALRTAYSMAYARLLLLVKTGIIGRVVSVDATCTTIRTVDSSDKGKLERAWNTIYDWGPTALLPAFQLLGTDYRERRILSRIVEEGTLYDDFSRIELTYDGAVATATVGKGVKSESDLVIAGTKGCVYVPAPWWKTDYFEVRFEDPAENKRFFYQLEGEGIRYNLVSFARSAQERKGAPHVDEDICAATSRVLKAYADGDVVRLAL